MLMHKGTVTLKTPRLILRRLTMEDAQAMYNNWCTDELVTRFLSWNVHKSVEETKGLLTKWVAEYENPEHYQWAIEYDGTIVGTIGLHDVATDAARCEMGYCIGSKWWNKGIMTEAAAEIIRFAFEGLNANKVCALHDIENFGSGRVMQKNDMQLDGVLREHAMRRDGTWGDLACYAILKREWHNKP